MEYHDFANFLHQLSNQFDIEQNAQKKNEYEKRKENRIELNPEMKWLPSKVDRRIKLFIKCIVVAKILLFIILVGLNNKTNRITALLNGINNVPASLCQLLAITNKIAGPIETINLSEMANGYARRIGPAVRFNHNVGNCAHAPNTPITISISHGNTTGARLVSVVFSSVAMLLSRRMNKIPELEYFRGYLPCGELCIFS